MMSFDQASALLRDAARPLEAMHLPLADAPGLRLAVDLAARIDAPRCDVSAMDGYALRDADLPGPLRIAATAYAGSAPGFAIGPGETARIFTGAPLPLGADRVVVQEIAEREGDLVRVTGEYGSVRHIRPRASDFAAGDVLLPAGSRLGPRQLVAACAADRAEIALWRRPRLAILATGDELAAPGTAWARPGLLPDSLTLALTALASHWGGEILSCRLCGDDPAAIAIAADESLAGADVLLVVGGASVGERDFAGAALEGRGFATLFARLAMRPGKPVWCAADGAGRYVLGLPGNPTSAMVTARLFLAPLLTALGGGLYDEALAWRSLELAAAMPAPGEREHFGRGRFAGGLAQPFDNQQSSAQALLADADLLLRQAGGSEGLVPGDRIAALDF